MPYKPLCPTARRWVETALREMTMDEKLAQLLHPEDRNYSEQEWIELLEKVPVGSVFIGDHPSEEMIRRTRLIQEHSRIPVLISADMENGAVMITDEVHATHFPYPMALGALNNPELARKMGEITARESRMHGVHWTLSPICDLNLNPDNPVTNIRALGDNPDRTIPLLQNLIAGLQAGDRMAACGKHFPGDGVDDRDQHMVTSCNLLAMEDYRRLYGKVWKSVIEAGILTVMAGHIALPDYQNAADDPDRALPATLSGELQTDLLRGELGFEGVVVSDAIPMIGIAGRVPYDEIAWRNIQTGSDSVLFANPVRDFENLKRALRAGKLSEERVEESCRRILELKARLKLHEDCFGAPLTDADSAANTGIAEKIATSAATVLRSVPGRRPVSPDRDKKLLTVSMIRSDSIIQPADLEVVDEELRRRGFAVDHLRNPGHRELFEALETYDRIFINMSTLSHAGLVLRLTGKPALGFWRAFFRQKPEKVVFTSFGSPYMLYELPAIDNLLCVWGNQSVCQRAAVKIWCGEAEPQGRLPVREHKARIVHYPF